MHSADGRKRLGTHKAEAADAKAILCAPVAYLPEAGCTMAQRLDNRLDGLLGYGLALQCWPQDEMIGLRVNRGLQGQMQRSGSKEHVAVGKQKPGRMGLRDSLRERMRFAEPALGQFTDMEDLDSTDKFGGQGVHRLPGSVCRAIVHGDDLELDAGLREQ